MTNQITNGQLVRDELSESLGHARRAAGYAAGGVRAAVAPRLTPAGQRVRSAAARLERTRTEDKVASRRWPKLAGLLASGALVGAFGAFILRRRRERQWESYEPMEAVQQERETATRPAAPAAGSE